MARNVEIHIKVTVAWWLEWYLSGVLMTAKLTGLHPDMDKVGAMVQLGVRFEEAD